MTSQTIQDEYELTAVTYDEDEEVEDDLAELFNDDFQMKSDLIKNILY